MMMTGGIIIARPATGLSRIRVGFTGHTTEVNFD
jgi:hypothetical protein